MSSDNRNLFESVDVYCNLTCAICLDLLRKPVELKPCGHLFCTDCIASLSLCPTCRGDIGSRSVPNRVILNIIEEAADVKCKRCGWRGNRAASAAHAAASCVEPTARVLSQPSTTRFHLPDGYTEPEFIEQGSYGDIWISTRLDPANPDAKQKVSIKVIRDICLEEP